VFHKYCIAHVVNETGGGNISRPYSAIYLITTNDWLKTHMLKTPKTLKEIQMTQLKSDKEMISVNSTEKDTDTEKTPLKKKTNDEPEMEIASTSYDKNEIFLKFSLYERRGDYHRFTYRQRNLHLTKKPYVIRKDQQAICDEIIKQYNQIGNCTAIIHGRTGTGKTSIGLFLAHLLNGSCCKTFNPTDPGDNITGLYNTTPPEFEKPLIVMLDEFDGMIYDLHNGLVVKHKMTPTMVCNKRTWNGFLDDIDGGFYPNMIVLMTFNGTMDLITNMDPSYVREGRIDQIHQL
jgi:hypothetical protein